jgi:hypothetical protein
MRRSLRAAALLLLRVGAVAAALWLLHSAGYRPAQRSHWRGDR